MEDTRSVFVSNISPNAVEKAVSDFFSFCGKITRLVLRPSTTNTDGSQEAIVTFETDSAAKTALLLTNALIVDRPITVIPYTATSADVSAEVSADSSQQIPQRAHVAPDSERTKTSVVASMLAAGYVLGSDTITKAREVDEKHSISAQLNVAANQVKVKADQVDKALHISETAANVKTATVAKAKEVDEKLQISAKAGVAAEVITAQTSALAAKAQENAVVAKGINMLKAFGDAVSSQIQVLKDDTSRAIDEKQGKPPGSTTTSSTTTTTTTTSPTATYQPAEAASLSTDANVSTSASVDASQPISLEKQ
eukprot:TRINITY_DN636_c0_g1_i1.p1 TRINITY_DN636_c0_g1~~TRINITY_DN636_c0_g1_i1.p1  ORF type:complete len:330 (-),score=108.55 TRINITY_DN636_c0_g1_i1:103-1032(-)